MLMYFIVFDHVTKLWLVGHKVLSLSMDLFAWILFSLCCCRSEWAWSERTRHLSNRQKLHYRGIQSLFLAKELWLSNARNCGYTRMKDLGRAIGSQRIVVMCKWKIYHAQQTRKELWLCWNGRFRMRSGLPRAFFLHWFSTAIWIICNLVKKYRNKRSNYKTNNFALTAYFCSWPTLVDREPKAFMMNSS